MVQVNLDRKTGALVDGYDVETLNLSENVPVLEGAFNVNGIEVSVPPQRTVDLQRARNTHSDVAVLFLCSLRAFDV